VAYLEAAHQGDFIHGSMEDVKARQGFDLHPTPEELDRQSSETYKVPTLTLPRVPPALCEVNHADDSCVKCAELANWCAEYEHEIDDLWLRCNLHTCRESVQDAVQDAKKRNWRKSGGIQKQDKTKPFWERRGCLSKKGVC
ncbi:hypothetical protein K438DRAFT_1550672, partial [Mycena galopus ATCC 62051]